MSKLKHTRKGRALLLKTTSVKKRDSKQNCARLPADGQKQKKKSKLYWK